MATLHPFHALRPRKEFVEEVVATVPSYRVDHDEARRIVENHPMSFLRVIKPEGVAGEDVEADVYEQGARSLRELVDSSYFTREDGPSLYIYRLRSEGKSQTGVFGCVAVGEYDDGTILPHEKTRLTSEADRVRHILAQQAHTEPVMLTYRAEEGITRRVQQIVDHGDLIFDFYDDDEVRHTVWRVAEGTAFIEAFGRVPRLYVADGHHRCEAASLVAAKLRERDRVTGEVEFFPAVLFPMGEMQIKAYNRVVYRIGMSEDELLARLEAISRVKRDVGRSAPAKPGRVCLYLGTEWHEFTLPPAADKSAAATLDVARLNAHVLHPLLGIGDTRQDRNLGFVSGRSGASRLEQMVDDGVADLAFSLFPTSIDELVDVADAGELMPPKSTWFEPKPRSGMLIHSFSRDLCNSRLHDEHTHAG